jgi:hypothetical protein
MGKNNRLYTHRLTQNHDISLNSPWLEESFRENQQTIHVKYIFPKIVLFTKQLQGICHSQRYHR